MTVCATYTYPIISKLFIDLNFFLFYDRLFINKVIIREAYEIDKAS